MAFSASPVHTFDMVALQQSTIGNSVLPLWVIFGFIFIGFAVKLPVFPLHTWLPDAHTDAPTAVSVILAGVLLKMGGYGMLRILVSIMPETANDYGVWLASLAAISVIYGAVLTLRQKDLKRLVAYSSVSHMGYVLLGIAALGHVSLNGAALQMFTHGTITALLFVMVGVVYDRAHTRDIDQLSGLAHTMPFAATVFVIAGLAALGLPALSGFVAELLVFLGSFDTYTAPTIIAVFGILLSAGYITVDDPARAVRAEDRAVGGASRRERVVGAGADGGAGDRDRGGGHPAIAGDGRAGHGDHQHRGDAALMLQDLDRMGPILAVMVTAGVILIIDLVTPREGKRWLPAVAIGGLAASAIWLVVLILRDRQGAFFSDTMVLDNFSIFFTFLFIGVSGAVILSSLDYSERFGPRRAEFFALVLIATSGMMLLAGARDLVAIFVALELTAITQFILAGFLRDDRGSEAALKYLLLGAVSSAVILYGMAFLFGHLRHDAAGDDGRRRRASRTTIASGDSGMRSALILSMVFLAAGFGFKMAIVPFQMWTPDVYEGSPTPVAAFLSVGSKAAAFAVVLRIFFEGFGAETFVGDDWKILFAVLAAVTMTVGNIMALRQTNIRRMLGYSSIAQAGNFLVGLAAVVGNGDGQTDLGASGVVFFLATYAFTNLGAFIAVMAIYERTGSDEIADYAGMGRRAPIPALVLLFCLAVADGAAADGGVHREGVHLQCGGAGGPGVAGGDRGAEHGGRGVLLPERRAADVPGGAGGRAGAVAADHDARDPRAGGGGGVRVRGVPGPADRCGAAGCECVCVSGWLPLSTSTSDRVRCQDNRGPACLLPRCPFAPRPLPETR